MANTPQFQQKKEPQKEWYPNYSKFTVSTPYSMNALLTMQDASVAALPLVVAVA